MKIRAGFVSNSSSCSFTVIFPHNFQPTTANVFNYLFAGRDPKDYCLTKRLE